MDSEYILWGLVKANINLLFVLPEKNAQTQDAADDQKLLLKRQPELSDAPLSSSGKRSKEEPAANIDQNSHAILMAASTLASDPADTLMEVEELEGSAQKEASIRKSRRTHKKITYTEDCITFTDDSAEESRPPKEELDEDYFCSKNKSIFDRSDDSDEDESSDSSSKKAVKKSRSKPSKVTSTPCSHTNLRILSKNDQTKTSQPLITPYILDYMNGMSNIAAATSILHSTKKALRHPEDFWPLDRKKALSSFSKPLSMFKSAKLSQLGSRSSFPLTAPPPNGQYIFPRNEEYANMDLRKSNLITYRKLIENHDFAGAAAHLRVLFSHVFDQVHYQTEQNISTNFSAFLVFMEGEIQKLGLSLPEMPKEVRVHLRKFFYTKKIFHETATTTPIRPKPDDTDSFIDGGVTILWLSLEKGEWKQKYDTLPENVRVINSNVDVHDSKTGKLLICYRKQIIPPSDEVHTLNKYAFQFTPATLRNAGNRPNHRISAKKYAPSHEGGSLTLGFLIKECGNIPAPTQITVNNNYAAKILPALGSFAARMEQLYAEKAPEQFEEVKKWLEPFDEFLLPGCQVTSAVTLNFDKQTPLHKDTNGNHDLENRFSTLTVLFGSEGPRYKGGETYFPELGIAFNVQEGDILMALFDQLLHCNTKIEPIQGDDENIDWSRMSAVFYTKRNLPRKARREAVFTSDDETDLTEEQIMTAHETRPGKYDLGSRTFLSMVNASGWKLPDKSEEKAETEYLRRNHFFHSISKPSSANPEPKHLIFNHD